VQGEWLDDGRGPDGVRVTFCVMSTVSRYTQALSGFGFLGVMVTGESRMRIGPSPWRQLRPQLLDKDQQMVGGCVVAIEADDHKIMYLRRDSRQAVLELAAKISQAVHVDDVSALAEWRR
jgi:hypothetical protein